MIKITVTGPPNSGKSALIVLIHEALLEAGVSQLKVETIDEERPTATQAKTIARHLPHAVVIVEEQTPRWDR